MRLHRSRTVATLFLGVLCGASLVGVSHAQDKAVVRPLPVPSAEQQMSVGPVAVPACGAAAARLSLPSPASATCTATVELLDETGAVLGQTSGALAFTTPLTAWYWTSPHDLVIARAAARLSCAAPSVGQIAAQPRLVLEFSGECTTTSNRTLPPVGPIIGVIWSETTY